MKRRTLLGAAGLIGIAGCFAIAGDQDGENGNGEAEADEEEQDEELSDEELEEEAEEEAEEEGEEDDDAGVDEDVDPEEASIEIEIDYEGDWSGAVGSEGSTRSVDGSGPETIEIDPDAAVVTGNAQKQDDSDDELAIRILVDGEVVAEESTTAEYGVAQVSETLW